MASLQRPAAYIVLLLLGGCATTDTNATSAEATPPPRRHHHRRHHADDATDPGAMPTTGAIGASPPPAGAVATGPAVAATTDPASGSGDAPAGSIGSPVVNTAAPPTYAPRYVTRAGHGSIVCDGAAGVARANCPQCQSTPDNTAIVHAFVPAERAVLACDPPADTEGRLPIHATFGGNGLLLEVAFPGVNVEPSVAMCMGAALCRIHTPTFRTAEATVDYEYVVLVPGTATTGG